MNYKYAGKEYSLKLDDDGQIVCTDLAIKAPTVDEVKKLIREQAEKEKSLPRVNVILVSEDRWTSKAKYIIGTTNLKESGQSYYRQVWVTHKDDNGKTNRSKYQISVVYEDTPENRERLDKYVQLKNRTYSLEQEAKELLDLCTTVRTIKA